MCVSQVFDVQIDGDEHQKSFNFLVIISVCFFLILTFDCENYKKLLKNYLKVYYKKWNGIIGDRFLGKFQTDFETVYRYPSLAH